MAPLLTLILPALLPVLADGARAVFNRVTNGAGARPANTEEAIKLMQAETEKLKALAELDKPAANISKWVADLRASFRYLAAAVIILSTYGLVWAKSNGFAVPDPLLESSLDLTGSVFSFLFGDRSYMWIKRGR